MSFDNVRGLRSSISNVLATNVCSGRPRRAPTVDPMSELELLILAAVAIGTSTMSGVVGFGGGVVLLAVLLIFFPPLQAIPIHGAIQIASNSSRAFVTRDHIDRTIVWNHLALMVPASVLGLLAASALPVSAGRALIGVFVLVATWKPAWITPQLERPLPPRAFLGVGAVQGFLNIPLGATGPLITPFFRVSLTGRQAFVATFAAAQTFGHIVKVGVFAFDGFDYHDHVATIAVGAVAVTLGSMIGTRLLGRVSERAFRVIFLTVITAIAIRLILRAIL